MPWGYYPLRMAREKRGFDNWVVTPHARFQMGRRGISEEELGRVLRDPEEILEVCPHRFVYQSRLRRRGKVYLLRVVVDVGTKVPEVVTAYLTSKVRKYKEADK